MSIVSLAHINMHHLGKFIEIFRHTNNYRLEKPSLINSEPVITLPKSKKLHIFQIDSSYLI